MYVRERALVERRELGDAEPGGRAARPAVRLANLFNRHAMSLEGAVPRFASGKRVSEDGADPGLELRRKFIQRLVLAIELEAVILEPAPQRERRMLAARVVHDVAGTACRVPMEQLDRDLRALDGGAWNAEPIGEIPKLSGNRAPAPADTRFGDSSFLAIGRLFIDDEIERHVLGEQIGEAAS